MMIRPSFLTLILAGYLSNIFATSKLTESSIQYLGRFDNSLNRQSEWPGSKIIFNVQAIETKVTITVSPALTTSNQHYYIGIEVNCQYYNRYEINSSNNKFQIILDTIPNQFYNIGIVKITEALQGDASGRMAIDNLDISGGNLQTLSSASTCYDHPYKLLVIGDSITAAYGVDGANEYCHYSASTQNIFESYATLVARDVDASVHTIAWSGKGVVRNYGDVNPTSVDPMPIFYNRTLATDSSIYWSPMDYVPDITLVALGTNDYSTQPNPSDEDFQNGYINFVNQIKADYPSTKIVLVCEPFAAGNQCTNIEQVSKKTNSVYIYVPFSTIVSYGCDYHPSAESMVNIANVVTPIVKGLL